MAPHDGGYAPIYERLVGEQGDVPAQARQAAEAVRRSVQQSLDATGLPHPQPDRYSQYQPPASFPEQRAPESADRHAQSPPDQPTDWSRNPPQGNAPQAQPSSSWFA